MYVHSCRRNFMRCRSMPSQSESNDHPKTLYTSFLQDYRISYRRTKLFYLKNLVLSCIFMQMGLDPVDAQKSKTNNQCLSLINHPPSLIISFLGNLIAQHLLSRILPGQLRKPSHKHAHTLITHTF